MDPGKTAPFDLGKGDGCLLIHGFTGSPWDLLPLGEALAARGFRAKGIRLPGHGTTSAAMSQAGCDEWLAEASDALTRLSSQGAIFVVGLSMGALISVLLAARYPGRVRAIALLAPAVEFVSPALRLSKWLRRVPLWHWLWPYIYKSATDIEDPREREAAPILRRFPTRRLADLWKVQELALEATGEVLCPALIIASRKDHVVAAVGAERLAAMLQRAQSVRRIELGDGFHIIPRDHGRSTAISAVEQFFQAVRAR